MPCNCIVDKPTYPQNEEWGPLLWTLLHILAEKAGRQENIITRGDESRAWPLFLKTLPSALPCPFCRDHLQDYLQKNPFSLPMDYNEWKVYIPMYFYQVHESVNKRLGKPSFSFSDLSKTYSDVGQLKSVMDRLEKLVAKAIQMGGLSLFHWRAWLKHYTMLRAAIL